MNRYVTKKENICIFKTAKEEHRGSDLSEEGIIAKMKQPLVKYYPLLSGNLMEKLSTMTK